MSITTSQAGILAYAFSFFNAKLFGGCLPDSLIVLHRHPNSNGYHIADAYQARSADAERPFITEIALNPDTFRERNDRLIFSTLVHEMCHLWQATFGLGYKAGAHNKEWGDKMESLGLIPSATGEPGGKKTGKRMTHYIALGGAFDVACSELLCYVHFQYEAVPAAPKPKRETVKRVKMRCPFCEDVEVRAAPGTLVRCGRCDEPLEEVG